MPWTPGTQLGGYEITGLLGAGGMGEVYRARDVRLHRDVALKVLPPSLLADPERRTRLEREARLLAFLSHPNIAAIYGIEDTTAADGRAPVLVLEFVEGETLAERLRTGPLPVAEAVAIGLQVAEALEAAHERGIVHRDLKPANVQLTPHGIVKVLDFGLAKALDVDRTGPGDPAQSPTITSASTQLGVVMGTAAYMAPEQARGRAVDRRADIWAFGALLYELLCGTRAFPGETISDTLAAVLTSGPDWNRLPADTPRALRTLLQRCLERDPRERLQSIGEARIVLARNMAAPTSDEPPLPTRATSPWMTAGIVAAAVLVTAAGMMMWMRNSTATPSIVRRLDIATDGAQTRLDRVPAIAPDGAHVAYIAEGKLWIRSLTHFVAKEIPNSSGAAYPFWSPDSRQIAFIREAKLWRASIDGGEPENVGAVPSDITGSGAGAWTEAGNFLVVGSDISGIVEISGSDGSSREVLALDENKEIDFHEVAELPGGRGVLFTAHHSGGADIVVFADGRRRDVLKLPGEILRSPVYDPAGFLLFGREVPRRGVWAVRFSIETLQTEGSPFLVEPTGHTPSVSRDGTLALVRRSTAPSALVWIDRTGRISSAGMLPGQIGEAGSWRNARLSPDGEKLAISLVGPSGDDVWLHDLKRGVTSPLSRGAQVVASPVWSPDGRLLFGAFAGGRAWNLYRVSQTEASKPQPVLAESAAWRWPVGITPDGLTVLYAEGIGRGTDLWVAPLDGSGEPKPLVQTPAREQDADLSPDGRWLAYLSDESGRVELYARRFPIGDDRIQLSNGGASVPTWRADGREIFYRGSRAIMSVAIVEKEGRLEPSAPQRLFELTDAALSPSFGVAPDGQRLLFARATGSDRISVILNWRQLVSQQP